MLSNDTNNIYHSIITNLLIVIYGEGKDSEVEALFTEGNLFANWLNTIAQNYSQANPIDRKPSFQGKCYFGHVHKLLKTILVIQNNFVQRALDNGNSMVKEAFDLFYLPKQEIEQREYSTPSDNKSEIFDNESEKFEEIFEVEIEKNDLKEFSGHHLSNEASPVVERDLNSPLIVDEEQSPLDDLVSDNPSHLYNDLNYWKTHIKFEEQDIYDLLK
jgi:hypothetical protein